MQNEMLFWVDRTLQIFFLDLLFLTSIRSPFNSDKPSIHAEAVEDSGGSHAVKDLPPIGGDEIRGHKGGGHLASFGNDLKDGIGLFFGR